MEKIVIEGHLEFTNYPGKGPSLTLDRIDVMVAVLSKLPKTEDKLIQKDEFGEVWRYFGWGNVRITIEAATPPPPTDPAGDKEG